MSLVSKLLKKAKKYVAPAITGFATGGFAGAGLAIAGASSTVGKLTAGLSQVGVRLPSSLPVTGAVPVSIQANTLPSFPSLPGQGGGFIKTGLPVALAAAAPAIFAGGRALVQRGAAAIAARGGLATVSKKVAGALGWVTVGGLVYDAAGNLQGRASRRQMNPLNQRAARRAIRRIKRVRKIVNSIERALPKAKSRRC